MTAEELTDLLRRRHVGDTCKEVDFRSFTSACDFADLNDYLLPGCHFRPRS
jgi:hypothetical protein